MYQITLDGNLIHDARLNDLQVIAPRLSLEANKIGSFTFTMPPNHEFYNRLEKLKSIISVHRDGAVKPMFKARVLDSRQQLNGSTVYVCEELTAYLRDTNFRPFNYQGGFTAFFDLVIATHNAQAEPHQQIKRGIMTVTDPNDYIARSSIEYLTCWQVLQSRMAATHGGYFIMRYENDGNYLDYLAGDQASLDTSTQAITFGENMIDFVLDSSASDTFSVCIPLGARLADIARDTENPAFPGVGPEDPGDDPGDDPDPEDPGDPEEPEPEIDPDERLTIESVNDGVDYLVNTDALAKYGWIVAPIDQTTWDAVTLPENLILKGRQYLNEVGVKLKQSLQLTALDLHNTDAQIEAFQFLDFIQVYSSRHNIGATYLLTRMELPLDDPQGTKITLGEERRTLTDTILNDRQNAAEQLAETKKQLRDVADPTGDIMNALAYTEEMLSTLINQSEAAIIMQVARDYVQQNTFQTYRESVATQFTQTSSAFEMKFQSATDLITQIDGDTKRKFAGYDRYIRFDEGNIILGDTASPLSLVIANDRISFRLNNNEIAYFSGDRLFVTNVEALTTLTLGNFAFFPRPGNQNLSFRRTKGA